MAKVTFAHVCKTSGSASRPSPAPAVVAAAAGPAHPRRRYSAPRYLLLAITATDLSASTPPPELAATHPDHYVRVRATVAQA